MVAWTRLRISNGAVEGMNNKINPVNGRLMDFEPLIIT
ncbi:MAG: hypothetical protein ACP5MB_11660 [bacterium]